MLSSNISSTCPHNMVNFGPLAAEIGPCSLGHLSKFQSTDFASWQRYCSDVAQRKPTKLCTVFTVSWAGTRRTHFWRFFPRYGILPGAKFTLHSILALLYFGNITAWHSSSGREPNFAALNRGRQVPSIVPCSNAAKIRERKTWTQGEFCTWQNSITGQEHLKVYM